MERGKPQRKLRSCVLPTSAGSRRRPRFGRLGRLGRFFGASTAARRFAGWLLRLPSLPSHSSDSRSLPGEICWNRPCDICLEPIVKTADGADGPFEFLCSARGCHRFHLSCALESLVRLQGCPICRTGESYDEDGLPKARRATIAQNGRDRLEERRVEANLPRTSPAPITFADWDIAEIVIANG